MFDGLTLFEDNFPNKKIKEMQKTNNYKGLLIELEKSNFLLPINSIEKEIKDLPLITDGNLKFVPCFTSIEEFEKWGKKNQLNFIFKSIKEMCIMLIDEKIEGFVIDPFGLNFKINKEIMYKRLNKNT
ncbi:MAG: SseB family protein [Bacilli bacterium]